MKVLSNYANIAKKNLNASAGFTMIELLIVIVTIGIMSGVAIVRFSGTDEAAVQTAARRLISDLSYCQEMAKMSGQGTQISIESGGGGGGGGGGACFVATACYGANSFQVNALRGMRDQVLMPNPAGRLFVDLYYKYGPNIASVVNASPVMQNATRAALMPLVLLSMPFLNDAIAGGGGGGSGGPGGGGGGIHGQPNTYWLSFQDGTPITNPQGGGEYVVGFGDQVTITSGDTQVQFDSVGNMYIPGFSWGGSQGYTALCVLNDRVNVYVARYTGLAWVG